MSASSLRFNLTAGDAILDPWNGVGTTTQIAQEHGHNAFGFDLNPATVIVAKARQLHQGVLASVTSLSDEIVQRSKSHRNDFNNSTRTAAVVVLP